MKMATNTRGVLALMLLVVSASAATTRPLATDFHAASCPQLESIVRASVQAALAANVQVTAGLLRIFFHDCLPEVRTRIYMLMILYMYYIRTNNETKKCNSGLRRVDPS